MSTYDPAPSSAAPVTGDAQRALLDAADALDRLPTQAFPWPDPAATWLRARAAALTGSPDTGEGDTP